MELKQFPGTKGDINSLQKIKELINQYQAFDLATESTDFFCPEKLSELASKYILKGFNNYCQPEGVLQLRKKISEFTRNNRHVYDPVEEITITPAVTQATYSVISSFVKENDEVIIIEPSNILYSSAVKKAGGQPVFVALKYPDFHIDWEEVRKLITGKTRMIILNTPHNPTGKIFSDEDMLQLQRLTNGTNIIILSEELFELLAFDNKEHKSVSGYDKLLSRSFIVSSFGPAFNINGWCLSWCLAPQNLMAEFRKTYMSQASQANTPFQYALAEYLDTEIDFSEITEFYQGKRNYFNRLMVESPFKIIPSHGTYFQVIDFSEITELSDFDFAYNLLIHAKVATMPLSAFYNQKNNSKQLRICFARTNETLEKAAENLTKISGFF